MHRVSDWDFAPLAPEALKNLSDAGYTLVVVSNQAGVGDGRFTEQEVDTLHQHMEKLLGQTGVTLDTIVYCPHHRDSGCNCRKPNPGLLQKIENAKGCTKRRIYIGRIPPRKTEEYKNLEHSQLSVVHLWFIGTKLKQS